MTRSKAACRSCSAHFHQIIAGGNTKHGGNLHDRTPFPSSFVAEEPSPPAAPATQKHEPGSIVADGQEYVAGGV